MAYAALEDVEARLMRSATEEEAVMIEQLLEQVEAIIRLRIPDLDQKILNGDISETIVVMVEVNAVMRVMNNPEAFMSETDGNYSYQRNLSGASGYLDILPIEWEWLSGARGMFQIIPVRPGGRRVEGGVNEDHWFPPPSWGFTVRVP
jgi:hypothetical protein